MTKEEIIKELNCCDFQDRQVLAEIGIMADGAIWMQKKMIDKACEWLRDNMNIHMTSFALTNPPEPGKFINAEDAFRKAMEE